MNLANFGAVRRLLLVSAVLTLSPLVASAQIVERSQTWANLIATHPCNAGLNGRHTILTDAQSSSSIGGGGGSVRVFVECDGVDTWSIVDIGGGGADLSAYALLAGDEDGQVIQGIAGENKAKLDIGHAQTTIAQLRGEGAAPGYVQANEVGAYLSSADESTYLDLYDGIIEFSTDGVLSASADVIRIISGQTPPTNANDACTAGDTIDTATFHYYCPATNTWVRVAMATWP